MVVRVEGGIANNVRGLDDSTITPSKRADAWVGAPGLFEGTGTIGSMTCETQAGERTLTSLSDLSISPPGRGLAGSCG